MNPNEIFLDTLVITISDFDMSNIGYVGVAGYLGYDLDLVTFPSIYANVSEGILAWKKLIK